MKRVMKKPLAVAFLFLLLVSPATTLAQDASCADRPALDPGRPTFSNSAATSRCRGLELDYGWTRQRLADGSTFDTLSTSLRTGLTARLDLQWSFDGYGTTLAGGRRIHGVGDNSLATRYRFVEQSRALPALALRYSVKFPSAPGELGGSGQVDHQVALLASRDVRRVHLDANLVETFVGGPSEFGRSTVGSLAASGAVTRRLGWIVESYGGSLPGSNRFASQYVGASYLVSPYFVMDVGGDFGLTARTPRRLLVGFSYAIVRRRPVQMTSAAQPQTGKGE